MTSFPLYRKSEKGVTSLQRDEATPERAADLKGKESRMNHPREPPKGAF